jgi:regulator of sigma E protease
MSLGFWVAAAVVLLGVLVLAHELGHLAFAKIFGVKVLRFSLGFGPKLVSFSAGGTEYRLSLVPLGGYVRLLGEDPSELVSEVDADRTLLSKPLWQRYLIVVAGPAFNLLLPVLIYIFHYFGHTTMLPPTIGTVLPGMPADESGLRPGDHVLAIDGRPVASWEEFENTISENPGKTLRLDIRRGTHHEQRDLSPVRLERRGAFRFRETVGLVGITPRFYLPEVGILDLASPAAQAGLRSFDLITSVNGKPVKYWAEVERMARAGRASPVRVTYLRGAQSTLPFAHVTVQTPGTAVLIPQPRVTADGATEYETGLEPSELFVFAVEPASPADRIGLRHGDKLLALDGAPVLLWAELLQKLTSNPGKTFQLKWASPGGIQREAAFKQEHRAPVDAYRQGEERLVFGAETRRAWRTADPVPIKNRFTYAVEHSLARTGQLIVAMTQGFSEIVRGQVPLSSLGGPITIGYVAGVAAEQGLDQYLWLLALLSINIGLLNFLPVPILDGGLLVFFTIELFKGRPPSRRAREIASYVGLVVVVLLMAFALKNDLVRFLLE